MNSGFASRAGILLGAFLGIQVAWAQVVISEFSAASSDRVLQREPGVYPHVGMTTSWQEASYDDTRWSSGAGPFGFGAFSGVTLATDLSAVMKNRATSLYLRRTFSVSATDAGSEATMQLLIRYNDGFIAFLNGVEVARRNMGRPGMFAFRDQTAFNVSGSSLETINLGAANTRLIAGQNLLSIQVHNQALAGDTGANFLLQADLQISGGATLVAHDAPWRYFPGLAEPSGGLLDYGLLNAYLQDAAAVAWAARSFNDATWPVATGPVGIEASDPPDYALGLNLYAAAYNLTPSLYTRRVFAISPSEAASTAPLRLTIDYDDGLIVHLNGREVVRRNLGVPGIPAPSNLLAASNHNANGDEGGTVSGQEEIILLGAPANLLLSGDNVLAVQLHRASLTSPDAIARVTLKTTGPGGRVLCEPTDPVRYFVGTQDPVAESDQEDSGPLEETPDSEADWIELYNAGTVEVSLAGWSLTDNAESLRKWNFPEDATIASGGYLLVLASGLDIGPEQGATYSHSNFKLEAAGEYLGLVNAEGNVVSEVSPTYPPQSYLHSSGRDTNGNWGFLALATPGAANVGTALLPAATEPEFSVAGGFHDGAISLMLTTTTAGAGIFYTLDGSEPSPGTLYTGPINILSNAIVRARTYMAGAIPSRVVTHTYLIAQSAAHKSIPALCLGGDPALTFYGPNATGGPTNGEGVLAIKGGIFVGNDYWVSLGDTMAFNTPTLIGRATEKPATLEYYPTTGAALRTDAGLRLSGSPWSRYRYQLTNSLNERFKPDAPRHKPSFNLFFRSEWGERPLDYPLFSDSPVTRFESVRIRAGKNDIVNPFIRDELVRRMFRGMGQQSSVGTFNTLYINGVFKGYYNLCERLREGFMQEHYQSSAAWDVQQVGVFADGDPLHWNQMMFKMRAAELTTTTAYQQVLGDLDVDNFIDYLILNAYAAMWDWPHNNWVAARERSDQGRWRFYVWDAEGGLGYYDAPVAYNSFTSDLIITDAYATTYNYVAALYTLLRVSPEFRLRFADRAQKHFFNSGGLVSTNRQALYRQLRDAINPIMLETVGTTMYEGFYENWIASDTRQNIFFTQLAGQDLWPATLAPDFSHYGGVISAGLELSITNPNADGSIYYTTNGTDPRAPGGDIAGQLYFGPVIVDETAIVQARVRSEAGVWSPVVTANLVVPPPVPTFLPVGSGDWTLNENWSSNPLPYPTGDSSVATIPPPVGADRDVNLRAPVTNGVIRFPQLDSTTRNRVRDQSTGNTLTFLHTNGPARIEVGGTASGYVEFEVLAGTIIQSDLRLQVTNLVGNPDYGALRLRANWSGPGGVIKSGAGVVSLTGDAKTYTGNTVIEEGVLLLTQPATPTASVAISVQSGGQLRLTSGNDAAGARTYHFGGPLTLAGFGRASEIPDESGLGKLGALRYDPGGQDNQATVPNAVVLSESAGIHVDGTANTLELSGLLSGARSITKSGGGTLRLSASNTAYTQLIQVENGALELHGPIGASVNVAEAAVLKGYSQVGALTGAGHLQLHQTLLRAAAISGLSHAFVFGNTGSPTYGQPAASGNSLLVLPAAPVSPQALDFYLPSSPSPGDSFRGGYFVPFAADLSGLLASVPIRMFVPDAGGSQSFAGRTWAQLTNAQVTTVAEAADFGVGVEPGRMLEIRVAGPPATFAAWQNSAFPNPADRADPLVAGPGADPQGSGVPNLLRYALGLSLTDSPPTRAPHFTGSFSAPAIRFPFDSGRNDLACVVEVTASVTDWSAAVVLFDSRTHFPPAADAGWITVPDPNPIGDQRYYRLRVFLVSEP